MSRAPEGTEQTTGQIHAPGPLVGIKAAYRYWFPQSIEFQFRGSRINLISVSIQTIRFQDTFGRAVKEVFTKVIAKNKEIKEESRLSDETSV